MPMKAEDVSKAFKILSGYKGDNCQILSYKSMAHTAGFNLSEFAIKYIIKNENYNKRQINKIISISSDFGMRLRAKYDIDFVPKKLFIYDIIGETDDAYHCYAQYRKSVPKNLMFINKKYILTQLDDKKSDFPPIDFGKYDKLTENTGRKLKEHQKTAVKFLLENKKCILADSQGLGKTASAIIAAMEGDFHKILVITTKSMKTTWKKEMEYYVDSDEIGIISGSNWIYGKKFTIINYDIMKNFYKVPEEPMYERKEVIVNGRKTTVMSPVMIKDKKTGELVHKMKKSSKKYMVENAINSSELFKSSFDCVIIDEVQKLSNNKSVRYKTIYDFLKKSCPKSVFLLTGTPLTNRPLNLYMILKLIDAEITKDYRYYCKRYCGGKEITLKKSNKTIMINNGATHLDELREKIKHLYIRRLQSEIRGMVNKYVLTKYYDLDERQKAEYDKLWNDYVKSQEKIGKYDSEKYKQLVEGILVRQYLAKEMAKYTIEWINDQIEYGEKVIVVCTFQEEISIFKNYYKNKSVVYDGKLSIKEKDGAVCKFMTDPSVMVFIGQIIACGVGLTLTSSRYLIFNSYSWVAADNLQVQDRIYRLTQKKDVTCIYQLFTDSISQHMFEKVMMKEMIMKETIKSEIEKNECCDA